MKNDNIQEGFALIFPQITQNIILYSFLLGHIHAFVLIHECQTLSAYQQHLHLQYIYINMFSQRLLCIS